MKNKFFANSLFVILFLTLFLSATKVFAMFKETHTYFVDQNAPNGIVQNWNGQPTAAPHTGKSYEGKFYLVTVMYPVDHRVKAPLKQWCMLTIGSKSSRESTAFDFQIKNWKLKDDRGNIFETVTKRNFEFLQKGYQHIENILNRKFKCADLDEVFNFYYDIPNNIKNLTLEFEIEITSPKGEKITVKDSIPLKRATFKTNFFEGLLS